MAKKSKTRGNKAPSGRQQRQEAKQTQVRQRQRIILGGVILVLVIGIGVFIRYNQQRSLAPHLQGALDNHYTRGVAGAPVLVKEFSDYA